MGVHAVVSSPRTSSNVSRNGSRPPTHRISSTRISTSAVVPTHKTTRAALRIAMLQEAIDNAHCAGSGSEHHSHHGHTDGEPAGLRVDVVHSRTLWPALEKGDSPRHRYSFAPIALSNSVGAATCEWPHALSPDRGRSGNPAFRCVQLDVKG